MKEIRRASTAIGSDFQPTFSAGSVLICHSLKNLYEVRFVEEEFLHKTLNDKDVCVDYRTTTDIPEDAVNQ